MYRTLTLSLAVLSVLALNTGQALAAEDGHDHDGHQEAQPQKAEPTGHPYPLKVDPLGESLVDVDKPITMVHEGRELRFASEENLKKFKAAADKYLAEVDKRIIAQQKPTYPLETCVVSGQKLGKMGDPVEFVYGNRLVRFCCGGCKGAFGKEPAQHLQTIDAAVIEAQKADYPMDTCVVSGMELGAMGEPVEYVIGTRLVRFCCKGCDKAFEKNPAAHLATIDEQVEQQ